jgi:hypothetical protein
LLPNEKQKPKAITGAVVASNTSATNTTARLPFLRAIIPSCYINGIAVTLPGLFII